MEGTALYDDGSVVLDSEGLTLRRYYFPTFGSKRIPYGQIRGVDVRPNTWRTARGRLWGTSSPGYWSPLDLGRPRKEKVVIVNVGKTVKPAFTPDDPERVAEVLRAHII